ATTTALHTTSPTPVASRAHRCAIARPSPSARTDRGRSPQICRGSRGRAAPYAGPPDRLSATRRVRGYSSAHHSKSLRRQALRPRESTASPENPEGVDSVLQLMMYAALFAPCPLSPRNLHSCWTDEPTPVSAAAKGRRLHAEVGQACSIVVASV